LLDFAPGAAAAYSLRQLSSGYAGPVVTVRRSSDNVEDSFTAKEVSDGTLAAWVGSGNNGLVKTWHDQSGKQNNMTAPDAEQPTIVSSGALVTADGANAIAWSSGKRMSTSAGTDFAYGTSGFFVSSVVRKTSAADQAIFNQAVAGTNYFVFYETSTNALAFLGGSSGGGTGPATVAGSAPLSELRVSSVRRLGASDMQLLVNGAVLATATNSTDFSNTTYKPTIGAYTHLANSLNWVGQISEIVVYKGDVENQLRDRIIGNQMWYY
jgi:hypothetical protein